MVIGRELGVEIVPGIEISAYDFERKTRAHILGFYVEPGHPAIELLCNPVIEKRHKVSLEMIDKIIAAGYRISREQVERFAESGTCITSNILCMRYWKMGIVTKFTEIFTRRDFPEVRKTANRELRMFPWSMLMPFLPSKRFRPQEGIRWLPSRFNFENNNYVQDEVNQYLAQIESLQYNLFIYRF
ncbi:hypothetical protein skT53_05480 [Effusibacillus dendaii]|uniref:Uncharacterized protein n=1 Tax=Effusibacillus dendaii TaxID=2743772 RepID=A0A7I8D5Y8_9BACL|nr:hypothetical protein skT53_05480 [Effusibacillus dendaii]